MGDGSLMSATFELNGQEFLALNDRPAFSFTEAVSLFVSCENQPEIDALLLSFGVPLLDEKDQPITAASLGKK